MTTCLIRAFMLVLLVLEIAWNVEQQNNIYIYIHTHKITHLHVTIAVPFLLEKDVVVPYSDSVASRAKVCF